MTTRPSIDELRSYLAGRPSPELIADLIALYAADGLVQDFYTLRLRPGFERELLARAKAQISAVFAPACGGDGSPVAAQQVLCAHRLLVAAPEGSAELLLHAAEAGAAYMSDYGIVDGPLATWLADTFQRALMILQDLNRLAPHRDRCAQIVRAAAGAGWGLDDAMPDIFAQFFLPDGLGNG